MSVVDELMAQRDAVLFGKWGRGPLPQPRWPELTKRDHTACLAHRQRPEKDLHGYGHRCGCLSEQAYALLERVVADRYLWPARLGTVETVNDTVIETASEAIDVLDEAIRLAKEAAVSISTPSEAGS